MSASNQRRRRVKPWDHSHIKDMPFVTREATDKHGRVVRERDVEEMIRIFKKRVDKSGVMDIVQEHRFFEKPSVKRRRNERERNYLIDKANERERRARKLRGDSR